MGLKSDRPDLEATDTCLEDTDARLETPLAARSSEATWSEYEGEAAIFVASLKPPGFGRLSRKIPQPVRRPRLRVLLP